MKKSIVLKSLTNEQEKGVLSLDCDGETLNGTVRLYGFLSEPKGILSLGISSCDGVIKAGLTKQSNMLFSFSTFAKSLSEDFSCAIVNFAGGEPAPLLYGTCGKNMIEVGLDAVTSALRGSSSAEEVEKTLDDFGLDYDPQLKSEIEDQIDKEFACQSNCSSCVYKQYFYQQSPQIQSNEPSQDFVKNDDDKSFYNEIKNQVQTLFNENKAEEFLQQTIPNSKWVKVEIDQGGDYYVFGLIYDQDQLKYVCYGVPSLFTPLPPKQMSGFPVWFPVDKDKKEGFGYWLTYQDAGTGESVKAIFE